MCSSVRDCWQRCLAVLREECSAKQFDTWLRPIQEAEDLEGRLCLLVPNNFVLEYIKEHFYQRMEELLAELGVTEPLQIVVGSREGARAAQLISNETAENDADAESDSYDCDDSAGQRQQPADTTNRSTTPAAAGSSGGLAAANRGFNHLNSQFTFENFVEGKSNQLAKAAALQVSCNPGKAYNPLFIYGGVGLGKTHLMHAVGNALLQQRKNAKVLYLHSERFVSDMIKSFRRNSIEEFKKFYRSLDALLIDDIQFFAGKERSQEELFHTFNTLLDEEHQMIMTCDRYPKEIAELDERLKSRFGWGLTVAVEPPELETRVAILLNKAKTYQVELSEEVVFFIAKHVQSNVRELEGALKKVVATAHFLGSKVTIELASEALKDLLVVQARQITIPNIQKAVAEYYKIRITDLISKNRSRNIARPRQLAMTLTKELTDHSLPEIADAFGGRDHTTVIHAQRTIKKLITTDLNLNEDYRNLKRILSG